MRTKINMDDDLRKALRSKARSTDKSIEEIVNDAIHARPGEGCASPHRKAYICRRFPMGYPPMHRLDKAPRFG